MTTSEKIDFSSLMEASGGNREIIVNLIQLFFDLTNGEIDRLSEAVREGNAANISAIAHKCAGSSVSCGMIRLSSLLKALEVESSQDLPADAPKQLEEIKKEMNEVKIFLEAHFGRSFAS